MGEELLKEVLSKYSNNTWISQIIICILAIVVVLWLIQLFLNILNSYRDLQIKSQTIRVKSVSSCDISSAAVINNPNSEDWSEYPIFENFFDNEILKSGSPDFLKHVLDVSHAYINTHTILIFDRTKNTIRMVALRTLLIMSMYILWMISIMFILSFLFVVLIALHIHTSLISTLTYIVISAIVILDLTAIRNNMRAFGTLVSEYNDELRSETTALNAILEKDTITLESIISMTTLHISQLRNYANNIDLASRVHARSYCYDKKNTIQSPTIKFFFYLCYRIRQDYFVI